MIHNESSASTVIDWRHSNSRIRHVEKPLSTDATHLTGSIRRENTRSNEQLPVRPQVKSPADRLADTKSTIAKQLKVLKDAAAAYDVSDPNEYEASLASLREEINALEQQLANARTRLESRVREGRPIDAWRKSVDMGERAVSGAASALHNAVMDANLLEAFGHTNRPSLPSAALAIAKAKPDALFGSFLRFEQLYRAQLSLESAEANLSEFENRPAQPVSVSSAEIDKAYDRAVEALLTLQTIADNMASE